MITIDIGHCDLCAGTYILGADDHNGETGNHFECEKQKTYKVVFHYTVEVSAADEDSAEDIAALDMESYLSDDEYRSRMVKDMAVTVDEVDQ